VWPGMEITMARRALAALMAGFLVSCGTGTLAFAAKDQARLAPQDSLERLAQQSQPAEPLPLPDSGTASPGSGDEGSSSDQQAPDDQMAPPDAGNGDATSPDDLSLGEIPEIQTMELTVDIAKRAVDAYVQVKDKYADTDLQQYNDLQSFVDQNPRGKEFEADIKAAGFANVNDWNLAITTLGFAYSGVLDDPTADIKQQISEIQADPQLAQDMKDRMIASLNAMIPSENNRKVVEELMKDQAYKDKLDQLDTEEE
jgi:hypothetical protein